MWLTSKVEIAEWAALAWLELDMGPDVHESADELALLMAQLESTLQPESQPGASTIQVGRTILRRAPPISSVSVSVRVTVRRKEFGGVGCAGDAKTEKSTGGPSLFKNK